MAAHALYNAPLPIAVGKQRVPKPLSDGQKARWAMGPQIGSLKPAPSTPNGEKGIHGAIYLTCPPLGWCEKIATKHL